MGLLAQLKKLKRSVRGRRWIVKRNPDNTIREVKCIFNPDEYFKEKNAKSMYGDRALIKILEKE